MTEMPHHVTPAGWYVDPMTHRHLRWWNGQAWTESVAPLPGVAPTSSVAPAPVQQPVPQFALASASGAAGPSEPASAGGPVASASAPAPEQPQPLPTRRSVAQQVAQQVSQQNALAAQLAEAAQAAAATAAATAAAAQAAATPQHFVHQVPAELVRPSIPEPQPAGFAAPSWPTTPWPAAPTPQTAHPAMALPPLEPDDVWAGRDDKHASVSPNWGALGRPVPTIQRRVVATRWSTASVWLLAATPWLTLAALVAALALFEPWSLQAIGVFVLPYLFGLLFAQQDASRLRDLGHEHPARVAWALLGAPVYLIARTVVLARTVHAGSPPLWVWLVNAIVVAGGCAALVLLPELLPDYLVAWASPLRTTAAGWLTLPF